MPQSNRLSDAKLELLSKYLRGDLQQNTMPTIAKRATGNIAPLSLEQQQIWLLSQLVPETPVYTESVTIRLPGLLDVKAFERSFNEIIRRHELWRTSFPVLDGEPVQMIHPTLYCALPVVDLRHLPRDKRTPEAIRQATEIAQPRFDLAALPLLRPLLVRLDDEEHRLYLVLHHIIFDGTIYEVFFPELWKHYEAFSQGKTSPLPPLPIQYADYAIWQRERLQDHAFSEQLSYWKQQLASAPETLDFPTDRPFPPVQSYHGARLPFSLSKDLVNRLKTLGQQEEVTLYMILVAAFQTLLYRYTSQTDILLGSAAEYRNLKELQGMIGVFLNTQVLRTNLAGNPTFRELLGRVREVVLEAHAHQDVPFEYLVRELQPERSAGRNPLVQAIISLQPPLPTVPSGWSITQTDIQMHTTKADLYLELDDRVDGFAAWLEYNTDVLDETTARRIAGHWQELLENVATDPTRHIAELSILTSAERRLILGEWNTTAVDYPLNQGVHHLFEAQVERTPEATAIVCGEESLTYRTLNERANQLAHFLQSQGVKTGMLVGVCVERSTAMMVALLGTLKAGATYVPIDPAYPVDRIAYMLQDSQASFIVTQQALVRQLPQRIAPLVCLDTDALAIYQESKENVASEFSADSLMYTIYTSGSTGRPKGVQIYHSAVVNFLLFMQRELAITGDDTLLAVTTLSFDIAVLELFLPLITGARLLIEKREVAADGLKLLERLHSAHPTIMQATPSTWRMLLDAGLTTLQHMRILCGGEALPQELAEQLLARQPELFLNMYGPTETTIWSTTYRILSAQTPISIGRPMANTQVYLLDTQMQPVPVGVPGELYIGGAGLARGYLNQPGLTAEKFVAHPFSEETDARLYRTGDLASYLPDGTIKYLGRLDHQVKIRGFRIELGEIEAILRQLPEVHEVVVVAREDVPGDKRLVAYIVPVQERKPNAGSIRKVLKEQLPDYMLPSAFVFLNALPLTPNGKIDRRALPAPDTSKRTAEENYVAPRITVHFQLLHIWEDLLSTRPIGIRDNFFLIGGHSLMATRLVVKIEQVFGQKISLATLFANPTIEQLAEILQERNNAEVSAPVRAIQATGSKRPFFFLHGDYRGGAVYCYPLARNLGQEQPFYTLEPYRFEGQRNPPRLEEVADYHIKALRSVQPEGPYQIGGFCNGGLTAYAVARQLQAEGEAVDLLVMMDPTPVAHDRWLRRILSAGCTMLRLKQERQLHCFLWLQHVLRYLRHINRSIHIPFYRKLQTEISAEQVEQHGGWIPALQAVYEFHLAQGIENNTQQERSGKHLSLADLAHLFPDALFPEAGKLYQDWIGIFFWVASAYKPVRYNGKSTFFFFHDSPGYRRRGKWLRFAKRKDYEVAVQIVAGTEGTCKTTHLQDLAESLKASLEQVQELRREEGEATPREQKSGILKRRQR